MTTENLLIWNVRGLNARARRNVVRDLAADQHVSLVCFQETKLDTCTDAIVPVHTCVGILLAWNRDIWSANTPIFRAHSISAHITLKASGESWWLTVVYGPQGDQNKIQFLEELRALRQSCSRMWMICGDFNIIYKATDKSNGRLHRRMMGRFRRLIDVTP
ncbi:hypothetical protein PVAP13_2NG572720 [Panicum virgatum]|uniref:Endonuclease/exonuclease/phosphatase domain-containing protein n=1 Tax=Panicum virgatum TaxID=38727 RepID=A0A8T0VMU0_PANVG|nr:hypothetical protein PVAP13_2NG572720 [Panicum virgatum]